MPNIQKLVFAVCTRNRPELLKRCIATVMHLDIPVGCTVEVAIIDNSETATMRENNSNILETLPKTLPSTILHESRLGIPFARNRALDHALATNADALVFLDDDQTVPHDWLTTVMAVAQEESADVVKTGVTFVFEGDMTLAEHFTRHNECIPRPVRVRGVRYISTNGVWISAGLYRDTGLRFDDRLGFLGCDDTAFFLEAYRRGANMVVTSEVYAQEIVLGDKQNLRWLTRRNFRGGVGRAVMRLNDRSRVFYVASGLSQALAYGLLAILLIWRQRAATRQFLRAAKSAGILWGALGGTLDEYRAVTGK